MVCCVMIPLRVNGVSNCVVRSALLTVNDVSNCVFCSASLAFNDVSNCVLCNILLVYLLPCFVCVCDLSVFCAWLSFR